MPGTLRSSRIRRLVLVLTGTLILTLSPGTRAGPITIVEGHEPRATLVVDAGPLTPEQRAVADQARDWFLDAVERASGARLPVDERPAGPTIVLTTAAARPEVARQLKLQPESFDGYVIATERDRVTLMGTNVYALRHAVAHVLRELGFRYYAPSPTWHIVPALKDVRVDLNCNESPDIGTRRIWYAYGQPDKALDGNYHRWVQGNRLSDVALLQTGHSYGNIILRNPAEFAEHPEYFALLPDGQRDNTRPPAARKFCVSNPGLMELVAKDRIRLLEENRKKNPLAYMVSVDPSDGQGTCHCEKCEALGTTTDRVIHLANHVARRVREAHAGAWVGLYAYSSHRLPPTLRVEPNVYVQVTLAFNQTEYTLPELVERWSKKTAAIGLREYYGTEAWDWGLPGRIRGGRVAYHQQWIPFYAARNANAFNGETNANWGGQMLGLYVASELMWDVKADVPALVDRYLTDCFGDAAPVMKEFQEKLEAGGPLQAATLGPMFADLERASGMTTDPRVQARLVDLMAYLVYVDRYRKFETVAGSQPARNDTYYEALRPLMTYAWRIRARDVVHYYALARRLCNGLPVQDGRPDFYIANKDRQPVWMTGDALGDDEIRTLFAAAAADIKTDTTRFLNFSRNFQLVRPAGADAGPSRRHGRPDEIGLAEFRGKLAGYFIGADQQEVAVGLKPAKRPVTFTVYARGDEVLHRQTIADTQTFTQVKFSLPRAGEFRYMMEGDATVQAAGDVAMIYEASAVTPAWVDYSGPHYFYVPRGTRQVYLDTSARLAMHIPGVKQRVEVTPRDRVAGQSYAAVDVPDGADGKLWHTDATTRGSFMFLNIPPYLCLNRGKVFVPREIGEADGLTTAP